MWPHATKDIFSQGACAQCHPTINALCYDAILAGEPRRRSEVGATLTQEGHGSKMPGRQGRICQLEEPTTCNDKCQCAPSEVVGHVVKNAHGQQVVKKVLY